VSGCACRWAEKQAVMLARVTSDPVLGAAEALIPFDMTNRSNDAAAKAVAIRFLMTISVSLTPQRNHATDVSGTVSRLGISSIMLLVGGIL
jgi:hypothetical protein